MANAKIANAAGKAVCHDCQRPIKIQGKEIKNGVMLAYEGEKGKITALKCGECFEKNPELTNFQPCEVYSRIVGYLRPVQQWNLGKKQEFGERKEYQSV